MSQWKYVLLGGSGGIGTQLCHLLKRENTHIVVGSRSESKLAELSKAIPGIETFPVDACDSKQVEAFVQFADERPGTLVGAANLVGSILLKPITATSEQEFKNAIETNLFTSFYFSKSIIKRMLKSPQGGSILHFTSAVALHGVANHEAIAAAKAGIVGLAMSSAATFASKNIRVNCVAPGLVDTPLAKFLTSNSQSLKASTAMHPLGRIGNPLQVAQLAAFLLHPENDWITGQVFPIDGGLSSVKN
ncbi:hypothetical protein GpartN1_g3502.t1 [Galdieria partita]|uniref:SDR family oxidoreductase n=1 Tax=Galdieria partita TaxID=83374 RepID=A0A9C7UQI6_9RHOD|nr:hypothetical protein GpartN1_g3502.t1 [Galdieria partita]